MRVDFHRVNGRASRLGAEAEDVLMAVEVAWHAYSRLPAVYDKPSNLYVILTKEAVIPHHFASRN